MQKLNSKHFITLKQVQEKCKSYWIFRHAFQDETSEKD